MAYKPKQRQDKRFYRTNERIHARELRVIGADGTQISVMSREEALRMAREQGLDLVEIAPTATPPVAKIIDFKKFLYQEEKKKREEKRKAKVSETKEVRLGPFMSDNDLQVMIKRGRDFLQNGDKVRFVVKFKGRQITRSEFGKGVLEKVIAALSDVSKVDRDPHFEGRQMIAMLSAERSKKNGKDKDQEISNETL